MFHSIELLRTKLNLSDSEALLIEDNLNIRYLTKTTIDTGYLIITHNNAYFITDSRYIESARKYFCESAVNVILQTKLSDNIRAVLDENNIQTLFIEADYQKIAKLDFFENCCADLKYDGTLDKALSSLRIKKSEDEIASIKLAQKITDDAFEYACSIIKEGLSERELSLEIEFFMRKQGAEGVSFELITISGKNTSLPHGIPSDNIIKKGDFVTMDIGCKVNGYCSDMTRTVAVGFATDKMKAVYNTVLLAQKSAVDAVKSGVSCKEVDTVARDIIYNAGYEGCFGHSTGHGVGLYIHEAPTVSARSDTLLQSGMVITVEPGIYLEDEFGVRIEDMVVVTEDGCENLTKSPKELIVL